MPSRIKNHGTELGGGLCSILGAITANQEQVDYYLRQSATIVALVAGGLSIWSFLRNRWKNQKVVKALLEVAESKSAAPEDAEHARLLVQKFLKNKTITPEDLQ